MASGSSACWFQWEISGDAAGLSPKADPLGRKLAAPRFAVNAAMTEKHQLFQCVAFEVL
jgi:hypothetical protein